MHSNEQKQPIPTLPGIGFLKVRGEDFKTRYIQRPVRLPSELRASTINEMEPREEAWCWPQALFVDGQDQVWVDCGAMILSENEGRLIHIFRTEDGVELEIPDCYKICRSAIPECGTSLLPVLKITVRPTDEQ